MAVPTGRWFSEDELLPLSALQHLLFCERQCALIHVEGMWAENPLTVDGQHFHARAHDAPAEHRDGARIARGLSIRSLRLGLSGKTDVVEFRPGLTAPVPFPVEYKRGRPKANHADRVQLCAQALCLEEMLSVAIPRGALYYGATRRRTDVEFDGGLRRLTEATAGRLHQLIGSGRTPRAMREPKCSQCSLLELCVPEAMAQPSAKGYLAQAIRAALGDTEGPP